MPLPDFVNEAVLVESHFLSESQVQPTAFIWREHIWRIVETGRQWDDVADDVNWHCYLVRAGDGSRFELRLDLAGARWILARAWLAPSYA